MGKEEKSPFESINASKGRIRGGSLDTGLLLKAKRAMVLHLLPQTWALTSFPTH